MNPSRQEKVAQSDTIYYWSVKNRKLIKLCNEDFNESKVLKCDLCLPIYHHQSLAPVCKARFKNLNEFKEHIIKREMIRYHRPLVWASESEVPDDVNRERECGELKMFEDELVLKLVLSDQIIIKQKYELLSEIRSSCPCSDGCTVSFKSIQNLFNHFATVERRTGRLIFHKANEKEISDALVDTKETDSENTKIDADEKPEKENTESKDPANENVTNETDNQSKCIEKSMLEKSIESPILNTFRNQHTATGISSLNLKRRRSKISFKKKSGNFWNLNTIFRKKTNKFQKSNVIIIPIGQMSNTLTSLLENPSQVSIFMPSNNNQLSSLNDQLLSNNVQPSCDNNEISIIPITATEKLSKSDVESQETYEPETVLLTDFERCSGQIIQNSKDLFSDELIIKEENDELLMKNSSTSA